MIRRIKQHALLLAISGLVAFAVTSSSRLVFADGPDHGRGGGSFGPGHTGGHPGGYGGGHYRGDYGGRDYRGGTSIYGSFGVPGGYGYSGFGYPGYGYSNLGVPRYGFYNFGVPENRFTPMGYTGLSYRGYGYSGIGISIGGIYPRYDALDMALGYRVNPGYRYESTYSNFGRTMVGPAPSFSSRSSVTRAPSSNVYRGPMNERGEPTGELRPGMVLPDGAIVISTGK